ncbi:MAG TPA: response regulator, partial [Draconibacterium sp.]|nr:response regulator [Draconibacterium sp.]
KRRLILEKDHNQRLHELDMLRTKFFINISHDLRTPLTLISGPVNYILQNRKLSREAINDNLILVKRNVKRLNYLVEQLLDVRKAESGKLSPKMKLNDIVSFVHSEVKHFNYALKKKRLELKITSNTGKIHICFDPSMISKVLFNIISNAIKFTEKGAIKIEIKKTEKENKEILKNAVQNTFVVVEITDTGKGMEEEQKEKIFNRFFQDPKSTEVKGYGIGLSHTKELIDAHNGFIEVESTLGVGTTFRFYLPDLENPDEPQIVEEFSTEDIYIDEEIIPETEAEQKKEHAQTILVIEDNADMRKYIKTELSLDYNIAEASDGLGGMKKAESIIPDLILSDVVMPNMDGIEMCKRIKSNIKTSHIPVILLTAKVDEQTKYKGIETGADDYIPKPLDAEYLKIRIKNLLQSREQLRSLFQNNPMLEPSKVTVTSIDEKFLEALMKEIEAGISDSEFSVNSLEEKMGMSHSSLYRKVKNLTGKSGNELLQTIRIKRAHQILSETKGIRVEEVAYMVGFNSPKYFSRCFREMYGIIPSDFKKDNH